MIGIVTLAAALAARIPAEWLPALYTWAVQVDTPDNLVAAMAGWIALETAAIGFLVRAYIAQRDRYDAMLEKMLTVTQENRAALLDTTEAIEVLAGKLERGGRGGARDGRTKKTS